MKETKGSFARMEVLVGLLVLLVIFLFYVSSREGKFRYEKNGVIQAPAAAIYAYISNFKNGQRWNPYDQKDPNLKRNFKGADGQVGAVMEFAGNRQGGTGTLEILKLIPNQSVEIKLAMTKPIRAENLIQYTLTPEGNGTRFSWAMSGDGGFLGKLVSTFIDCEKMVTKDFVDGIEQLKKLVESEIKSP
jgi:hypothetical protein